MVNSVERPVPFAEIAVIASEARACRHALQALIQTLMGLLFLDRDGFNAIVRLPQPSSSTVNRS